MRTARPSKKGRSTSDLRSLPTPEPTRLRVLVVVAPRAHASIGGPNIGVRAPQISGRYTNLPCQTEINWSEQTDGGHMLKP
jgi:hypothetical protein